MHLMAISHRQRLEQLFVACTPAIVISIPHSRRAATARNALHRGARPHCLCVGRKESTGPAKMAARCADVSFRARSGIVWVCAAHAFRADIQGHCVLHGNKAIHSHWKTITDRYGMGGTWQTGTRAIVGASRGKLVPNTNSTRPWQTCMFCKKRSI